jgi:rubredoxin
MPLVVAMSEIPANKVNQPGSNQPGSPGALSTTFFRAGKETPDAPTAALNRYPGGESRYSAAHFHAVDQFQVMMEGSGTMGRHAVQPYSVHFSRAYTPYGPLISAKETGWGFIVLRSRRDSGAQRFPDSLEKLKTIPNRNPWQVTAAARFAEVTGDVATLDVPEIQDEQGLYTRTITLASNARTSSPDQKGGDGQYIVLVNGSVLHEGVEKPSPTVIFLKRDEAPIALKAGAQGAQLIVMNFPKVEKPAVQAQPESNTGYKVYQCLLCAFMYDEAAGMPDEGIAPGTRWKDVPDTWTCPDCSAGKADFDMVEVTGQ